MAVAGRRLVMKRVVFLYLVIKITAIVIIIIVIIIIIIINEEKKSADTQCFDTIEVRTDRTTNKMRLNNTGLDHLIKTSSVGSPKQDSARESR